MATNWRGHIRAACALIVATGLVAATSGTTPARAAGGAEIVAHNGGTAWGPESTLAAFGHDIDVHAYGIEFAVRFSRDGVPVVIHDATLDRTTNCSGYVADRTFDQLEQCDAGVRFARRFAGARIPSLDQTLSFIGRHSASIRLFIHVKRDDAGEIGLVMRRLDAYGLDSDRTTLIGSTLAILSTMRAAGAKRLGYVFNDELGWSTDFPVLIPYDVPVGRADLRRAEQRGQQVLPVEDHPFALTDLTTLGTTGVLANDVDAAIRLTGPSGLRPSNGGGAGGGDSDRSGGAGGGDSDRRGSGGGGGF